MLLVLLIGIISTTAMYYIYELYRTHRMRNITEGIPGPKALPLVGSALQFGTNSVEILKNSQKLVAEYGTLVKVWLGPYLYILVSDVKDIEVILNSSIHLNKSQIYDFFKPWLGTGLISVQATKWRTQRRILTPAFHFKILETYVEIFNENTMIMLDLLERELDKESFDIGHYIDNFTLDVICETAMATKINAQLNKESAFPKALKVVSDAIIMRSYKPWLIPDAIFNISPLGKKFHKHLDIIIDYVDKVIAQKKKDLSELSKNNKLQAIEDSMKLDEEYYGIKKRMVFLDLMLMYAEDPDNNITDRNLRDEVNTFMFAGHDTTASTIGFTIYMLGSHPEVQSKVFDELWSVFGDSDREPTYQDLMGLKYMEQVIKETLRLYPAVPYIGRGLHQDLKLPSGHILPAGSNLTLFLYKLHRDPKVFPDPEQFNPDNFLLERLVSRNPFAYTPFSAGPRNCIGQKFAMLEVKAVLSGLVRRFKVISRSPEPLLASQMILRSKTGINVRLEKRSHFNKSLG